MHILISQTLGLAGEDARMGAKRKSYTPKYRGEAARLEIDTGRTIAEVAREIGVGEQLLGRWVALERARMDREFLKRQRPSSPARTRTRAGVRGDRGGEGEPQRVGDGSRCSGCRGRSTTRGRPVRTPVPGLGPRAWRIWW